MDVKAVKTPVVCRPDIHSEQGMASLEMLPLLFVFIFMFAYTLGLFGSIHTGIKNSIGARQYLFETVRNRVNVVYFRDTAGTDAVQFSALNNRIHGIKGESQGTDAALRATERALRMGITIEPGPSRNDPSIHVEKIPSATELNAGARDTGTEASPIWIMVVYGLCLNLNCGDS